MKTKPFDLEAAKAGAKLVTRNGRPARIICYDRKDESYTILALIDYDGNEEYWSFTNDGRFNKGEVGERDLLILQEPQYVPYETGAEFMQDVLKHKGWVRTKEEDEYERCYYPLGAFCTADKGVDVISSNPPKDWGTSFLRLLDCFVWADDGTPCGILKG